MQSQRPHNYSAADIERYHNGGMTDAEMHALEKAALDDPFLADAIDGYRYTKTPAADIAFLKEQLQHRSEKVFPMYNARRRLFVSIAAMVVLMVSFGWLAYQFSNTRKQDLAVQKVAPPQKVQPMPTLPATDSNDSAPAEGIILQKGSETKQEEPPARSGHTEERSSNQIADSKNGQKDNTVAAGNSTFSNTHAPAPLSRTANGIAAKPIPENTFKAKVVDEHNNAVPYAIITNQQQETISNTDTGGNFSIPAPNSSLTVAINSVGYQQQQKTLVAADSATKIVLQPASNALNEVVVSRKSKATDTSSRVKLEAAVPIGGLRRFNTFVDKSIANTEDLDALTEEKEVVLSFDVDPSGNAINVLVEKSLCASCDTTAVRLIQQGTKWRKTKSDVKAKARIRF